MKNICLRSLENYFKLKFEKLMKLITRRLAVRYLKNICLICILVFTLPCSNILYADTNMINNAYASNGNPGHGFGKGSSHGVGKNNPGHQGNPHQKNMKQASKTNKARLSDQDAAVITKYYSANPFPVSTLPPGIAKNLARGKPLPPGIAKVFLPSDLTSKLPAYPGYEYLAVDKDVVLMNTTTNTIADILTNVLK